MTPNEVWARKTPQLLICSTRVHGDGGWQSTAWETDLGIQARFTWYHHCQPLPRLHSTVPVHTNIQVTAWRELLNVGRALVNGWGHEFWKTDRNSGHGDIPLPRSQGSLSCPSAYIVSPIILPHIHTHTLPFSTLALPQAHKQHAVDEVIDLREECTESTFLSKYSSLLHSKQYPSGR